MGKLRHLLLKLLLFKMDYLCANMETMRTMEVIRSLKDFFKVFGLSIGCLLWIDKEVFVAEFDTFRGN